MERGKETLTENHSELLQSYCIIKRPEIYLILGSHSGDYLLKCDTIQSGMGSLPFRWDILTPFSG
jgi:hypothetical protein